MARERTAAEKALDRQLLTAAKSGNLDQVRTLIEAGVWVHNYGSKKVDIAAK